MHHKLYINMNLNNLRRNFVSRYSQLRSAHNKSPAMYCLESVKQHDYENFLATLLLKNTERSSALAIRSFNIEISKVATQVSQQSTGLMRLQFWKDAIDACYAKDFKKVPQHPVAIEIMKVVNRSKLTKRYFETLIKCRSDNMNLNDFQTLKDLETYSEQSVSSVYYLILEGCGIKNVNADHVASHLGKAQGITQLLRATEHAKQLNISPLPLEILSKNRVSQEDIFRRKSSDKLSECIFEVASRAHQHLVKARSLLTTLPHKSTAVFLPAVTVDIYLQKLQSANYEIFDRSLKIKPLMWLPKLWLYNFRNRY